jgi:putative PEP-CTERM system histidine kinase
MANNIGLYSYGFACLAYVLLGGALLLIWKNRSLTIAAIVATVLTAGWAGLIAGATLLAHPPLVLMQSVELARNVAWLFLLLSIFGGRLRGGNHPLASRRWIPWALIGLAVIVITLFGAREIGRIFNISESITQAVIYGTWMSQSLIGVLLLENIYRNSTELERWWVRYLCTGLGFLFAYDFLMYSDALVFREIDAELWLARGFSVALSAPLVALAAARSRDTRRSGEGLSRHMVLHTFSLLLAGIYLVLMAVVGYFVNYLGGTWGSVLQVVYLSATGLLLVVLVFSSRVRALSRVWLSKYFLSYKYDYRREWLEFSKALEDAGDDTPQAIIQAMAKLGYCRAGLLWARSGDGELRLESQWQMAINVPMREHLDLFSWLEETGWIIDVQEWKESPQVYVGLEMPRPLARSPGAWIVIPLMAGARVEGVLFLRRTQSNVRLNWEDRDLLKLAGRQAARHLVQFRANQSLVELRQFEAFSRLSAYVVHDLKNILAEQSLIVSNADRHRGNLEFFDDVIATVDDSVERMTRLMAQVSGEVRGGKVEFIELGALLRVVLGSRTSLLPKPILEAAVEDQWVSADGEQLATVFGHIIQNAKEATDKHGRVVVRLLREGDKVVVEIEDDGAGMSSDFIQRRLFTPFESTKGLTGMGIGAFESRELVRKLGGDIFVSSEESVGSNFRIMLPFRDPDIIIRPVDEGDRSG